MKRWLGLILMLVCAPALAQVKISQLPSAGTLTGLESIPIVQNGQTVITTPAAIRGYIESQTNTFTAANTFSALATFSAGAVVSSGNFSVTSGTTTLGGATTVQSGGLTVTAGGEVITAGGLTVNGGGINLTAGNLSFSGTGNFLISNSGYLLSDAATSPATTGVGTSGVAIGTGGGGGSAAPMVNLINSGATAGNRSTLFYEDTSGSLHGAVSSDNGGLFVDWLDVTRNGTSVSAVNFPNGAVEVGGAPLAFGTIINNGSTCSVSAASDNSGIASATRNAPGICTITFSNASPHGYTCALMLNTSPGVGVYNTRTTTTAQIATYNLSGAALDVTYDLYCR